MQTCCSTTVHAWPLLNHSQTFAERVCRPAPKAHCRFKSPSSQFACEQAATVHVFWSQTGTTDCTDRLTARLGQDGLLANFP